MTESKVQGEIRLEASRKGVRLWRNNVGVFRDSKGRAVRFGLCNDSSRVNKSIKSADLIGIRPVVITQEMVGATIGMFVSIECKHSDWHYTGTDREVAQQRWIDLVREYGGDAKFVTSAEGL